MTATQNAAAATTHVHAEHSVPGRMDTEHGRFADVAGAWAYMTVLLAVAGVSRELAARMRAGVGVDIRLYTANLVVPGHYFSVWECDDADCPLGL